MKTAFETRPSPIHGTGAFAVKAIPAGAVITEYRGELVSKDESRRRQAQGNAFLFYLDEKRDLDGSTATNPARFCNHSCSPNCEISLRVGRLWLVAQRHITIGEELTFDYGYDLRDYWRHPCRCGAAECAGYIVAAEFRSAALFGVL